MGNIELFLQRVGQLDLDLINSEENYGIIPLLYSRITTKELLHSEIIAHLLNIDPLVFEEFIKILGLDDDYSCEKIKIYTEYGVDNQRRIDLLITIGDNKAIIIENKLNNAIDQENQLEDYCTSINSQQFEILRTVYLPLYATKKAVENVAIKNLINIYPNDLITWLKKSQERGVSKFVHNACYTYELLLKNINQVNRDNMNAREILEKLNAEDINTLIDLSAIISSPDWHKNKLKRIQEALEKKAKNCNIQFSTKKKGEYISLEIWLEGYSFWIQVYSYDKKFALYLASVGPNIETEELINSLGFTYSSDWEGSRCYKNKNKFEYAYPSDDDSLTQLIDYIIFLLSKSK